MRFCSIALVGLCMLASVVSPTMATCPSTSSALYAYSNCTEYMACHTTLCTCLNGPSTSSMCSFTSTATRKTCAEAAVCTKTFVECVNTAAGSTTNNCSSALSALRMSLLMITSGQTYTDSGAYSACQNQACMIFNHTVTENCTLPTTICVAPSNTTGTTTAPGATQPTFEVTMNFGGDYTAIFANATAKALLQATLAADLARRLGTAVTILSMTQGGLVVVVQVQATDKASLDTQLAAAQADQSWMAATIQVFTDGGGTGTMAVLSFTSVQTTTAAPGSAGATSMLAAAALVLLSLLL